MKRVKILAICALAVAIILPTIAIGLMTPNFMGASQEDASHVELVVYQIGISHVVMTIPVDFVNSKATILLPSSAILQTLRVSGVDVISMRLRQTAPQQLLVKGDSIIVHTQSGTYQGTFEGIQENYIVITQEGKSTLIGLGAVTAIEVSRAVAIPTMENAITLEITADVSGPQTLNVSFLSRGTSWEPSHFLDLLSGNIQTWATVSSSDNWSSVSLTLVVGQPHIVFEGSVPIKYTDEAISARSNDFTVTGLGEYHAYRYARPFTISSGDTAMILLLSGTVDVKRYYFWAGSDYSGDSTPIEYANVTNVLDEPIPEGLIQFYRGSEWVGNDMTPYIAVNSTAKLMVAYAHDLKIEQKTVNIEHLSGLDKVTVQVKAMNYKAEGISITIQQTIPYQATLESSDPQPIQEGQVLTWTVALESGGQALLTYTYSIPVQKSTFP
jgi:hypothetical protein